MYKILIFILLILSSCKSTDSIIPIIEPLNSFNHEVLENNSILTRSLLCDITIKSIFEPDWEKLINNNIYINSSFALKRMPPIFFFIIIIENTSDITLTPIKFSIKYNKKHYDSLSLEYLKKHYNSQSYNYLNFKNLFSPRKITIRENILLDMNIEENSIKYGFNFILPNDKILYIIPFDKVPLEIRNFSFFITLNSSYGKKIIDFDLVRNDYSSKGKYFINRNKTKR